MADGSLTLTIGRPRSERSLPSPVETDEPGQRQETFFIFSDIRMAGRGRTAAGLGAILLHPGGHTIKETCGYRKPVTAPEAEILAVGTGLQLGRDALKEPSSRRIFAFMDSQTAYDYIERGCDNRRHLVHARQLVRGVASGFAEVAFHRVNRDNMALRRCESLARQAMIDHGHDILYRGSKYPRHEPPADPFEGQGWLR